MGVRILWLYQYDRLCSLDICPGVWWQGLWLLCASAEGWLHQKPKVDRHVANLEIWDEFWYHLYILETLFYFWKLLYTFTYHIIIYIYNMYTPEITGEIAQWNAMQSNVILIYCHRLQILCILMQCVAMYCNLLYLNVMQYYLIRPIWRFPKMGVSPHHPFQKRIQKKDSSSYWIVPPWLWKPLYVWG